MRWLNKRSHKAITNMREAVHRLRVFHFSNGFGTTPSDLEKEELCFWFESGRATKANIYRVRRVVSAEQKFFKKAIAQL